MAVVEGFSRCGHGVARILWGSFVDHRGDAAVRGVDDLAGSAVGRVPPLSTDQEIRFTVHLAHLALRSSSATPSGTETGHYPLMELRDVMFGRNEDTTVAVGARRHRRLSSLARLEVLLVDPVEQLDRA